MKLGGSDFEEELGRHHPVDPEQIQSYREDGFVKLSGVFSRELLERFKRLLSEIVARESRGAPPLAERSSYGRAFTQITNLWTRHEEIRPFVFNRCCARIASDLLGVAGVRLWHDQALFKEAGGGDTHWHSDLFYWPMSSDRCVTAWIPLQDTPVEAGALQLAAGSHLHDYGRGLGISEAAEQRIGANLRAGGVRVVAEPFEAGDVSFHSGLTFHRADPNASDQMRAVMTVIYMDEGMRVAEPTNPFQKYDQQSWAPGCAVGEPIASPINPVLFSRREDAA